MMQNNETVLITGAAGFIGSFLVKRFLKSGYKVIGIDNINSYYDKNLKLKRLKNIKEYAIKNNFNWLFYKSNIEDKNYMRQIFLDKKPQIVVNLAAQAGVRYSIVNPYSYVESNLLGFSNILDLCQTHDVKHLVYASSSSVYGANKEFPFSEEQKVDTPLSFYAATKISNEMMAHAYSNIYNLPITGLRFFTVYGPWGRPDMAPMIFADKILQKKPITVFNHGNMSRDFTFISDIIEGTYLCCLKVPTPNDDYKLGKPSIPHRIFNIGNGNPVKLLDFVELLEEALSIKATKVFENIQPGDVESTYASTQNLEDWIGYRPLVTIKEGVNKFANWYLDYYQ
jgi:UDP-glucuronate 4-epimerase